MGNGSSLLLAAPPAIASATPVDHGVAVVRRLADRETRLGELGISNTGIVDASYGSGVSFRDPDNIALELFAPPG